MLSDKEIIELQEKCGLIIPFVDESVRENGKPSYGLQPHGYDVRLSADFGVVASTKVNCPLSEIRVEWSTEENTHILIPPHSYIIVKTLELLRMPSDLVGVIRPKSTYIRKGLSIFTAIVDVGFKGKLEFGVYNFNPFAVNIPIGAGIAQIVFFKGRESLRDYVEKGGMYAVG